MTYVNNCCHLCITCMKNSFCLIKAIHCGSTMKFTTTRYECAIRFSKYKQGKRMDKSIQSWQWTFRVIQSCICQVNEIFRVCETTFCCFISNNVTWHHVRRCGDVLDMSFYGWYVENEGCGFWYRHLTQIHDVLFDQREVTCYLNFDIFYKCRYFQLFS